MANLDSADSLNAAFINCEAHVTALKRKGKWFVGSLHEYKPSRIPERMTGYKARGVCATLIEGN